MAKTKTKATAGRADPRRGSTATANFWPCTANLVVHPALPVACRIMKGPNSFHIECGACKTRTILAPALWKESFGMTPQQVHLAGLTVLA